MTQPSQTLTMTRSRPIVSDQPSAEIWKLLRFFLDEGRTAERIRAVHGIPQGSQTKNVQKQAKQLAQSIRQAEEYFTAASRVTLATRPTLLYYGAVSLARALILLRLDGSHSDDALRKAGRHRHHGLDLDRSFEGVSATADPTTWLDGVGARVHLSNTAEPWGNFPLFYRALIAPALVVRNTVSDVGATHSSTMDVVQGTVDPRPLTDLVGKRISLLTLIRQMPDMWLHLVELGLEPDLAPGRIELTTQRTITNGEVTNVLQTFDFFIFGARPTQIEKLKELRNLNPKLAIRNEDTISLILRLQESFSPDNFETSYIPDAVDSLTRRHFFIPHYEAFVMEPAGQLATLYSLSMIARYYADIWMSVVERNVLVGELLDSVLSVVARKFPLLVLDQLTDLKHYVDVT